MLGEQSYPEKEENMLYIVVVVYLHHSMHFTVEDSYNLEVDDREQENEESSETYDVNPVKVDGHKVRMALDYVLDY